MSLTAAARRAPVGIVDAARNTLAPLGSASALSWRVMALYCPVGIVIQATGNASIYGGGLAGWALASATGMVVLCAVLSCAHAMTCRRGEPRPMPVLASYAIAGVAQSLTLGFTSVLIGLASDPQLSFRLSGLLLHLPLLAAVGYTVSRSETHRQIIIKLEGVRTRLLAVGLASDAELELLEAELSGAVRSSLEPALESLDATLSRALGERKTPEVLAAVDNLIEERVRPLSHELVSQFTPFVEPPLEDSDSRPRVPLPKRFLLSEGISPGFIAGAMLVASIPTAAREFGPTADLVFYLFALTALTWMTMTLARSAVGTLRLPTRFAVAAVIFIVVILGAGVFWLIAELGIPRPTGIRLAFLATFALVAAVSVVSMLVQKRRLASEKQLEGMTLQLELAVNRIRRRRVLVQRRLAFILHGALQGALHSAALRIRESDDITGEIVSDIRRDIAAALAQVGRPQSPDGIPRTRTTLADLTAVWNGPRKVIANLDPSAESTLTAQPDADEAVAEVVREAVNNAFRHGDAATIEIRVSREDDRAEPEPGAIGITVTDDGAGPAQDSSPGLGSSLFFELCSSWELSHDERGTTLQALVQLR